MEKSNIEVLREFARSTNRAIVDKEIAYPMSGIRKFPKYKRYVYIPYNLEKTSYFIWYSDPFGKVGMPTIFCGAFIPLSSRNNSKINIRKRTIADRLNLFSKTNVTGNDNFDSKVVIKGDLDSSSMRLLYQSKLQNQLLEALKLETSIVVSMNEYKIDFIPEFQGKSYLSVINPQVWIFKKDEIEKIFKQVERIRNTIFNQLTG